MPIVNFYNLGAVGIVKDIPGHLLPPEAWTDGANMRMQDGMAKRWFEPTQVFGTPNVAPGFVFAVPGESDYFWLYANLTSVHAFDGVSHTDITRLAGPYTTVVHRNWNGCILGGVPILCNGSDVPQYWPTLAVASPLENLANWPSNLRAKLVRNFGEYLVALNLVDAGSVLSHAIRWSHPADPGTVPVSWDVTDPAFDAGQRHLTDIQGGEIVEAQLLGNYLVIYKQRSTHLMRFIGGTEIMGFELLLNQGLIAPRCTAVVDAGLKHFCVGEDDIYVHSATKNVEYVLDRKDRRYLYGDIDGDNFVNSFAFDNPSQEEAWFAYPTEGMQYPNKALVWNYRTGEVGFKDFVGTSVDIGNLFAGTVGTWDAAVGSWDSDAVAWNIQGTRKIVASDLEASKFWSLDTELAASSPNQLSFLQRTGLAIVGKDRQGQPKADFQSIKMYKRVWPKITGSANVEMRIGVHNEFDGAISWGPYYLYDKTKKFIDLDPPLSGRFGAIEFRSVTPAFWQVEGYDLDLEVISEY